jgi:hypothetical protein
VKRRLHFDSETSGVDDLIVGPNNDGVYICSGIILRLNFAGENGEVEQAKPTSMSGTYYQGGGNFLFNSLSLEHLRKVVSDKGIDRRRVGAFWQDVEKLVAVGIEKRLSQPVTQ